MVNLLLIFAVFVGILGVAAWVGVSLAKWVLK
jgi:hypothetical protein